MAAALTLLSVVVLLGLLVHGRLSAAVLFSLWAAGYFLFGLIDEKALLSSYANPALATLILLLLVSLALERSVLLERMTNRLLSGRESMANIKLMGVASVFSAFLNNTAVVGILLGAISRQKRIPASRLLIPLSYASILGGITTLVGTSTNLVVNSFAVGNQLAPIGMFQLAWVGVPVALACIVVISISARWLPRHNADADESNQPYFLEARVSQASPLAGRSIEANGLRHLNGLFLLEIERAGRMIAPVGPEEVLEEDDVLLFTGEVTKFQALQHIRGMEVFGTRSDALLNANLVEAIVTSESELTNKTLRDVDFRTMFDAGVVGIRRGDKRLQGQLGRVQLKAGDCLLLATGADFAQRRNIARRSAMGLMGLLPGLMILMGVFLATKLLTLAELRRRFPFELLMVIGSALALAKGLENSGGAQLVANAMRDAFEGYGVYGALVGVYLLTLVLTELVTNNAAAALAFPIALATARAFGVDPTAFVMVVAYGASACFLLPFGYQTHLMVMAPGRYRTTDFLKTGLPVSVTYSVVVLALTPWFFPLTTL